MATLSGTGEPVIIDRIATSVGVKRMVEEQSEDPKVVEELVSRVLSRLRQSAEQYFQRPV